jgi:hypothetical protein
MTLHLVSDNPKPQPAPSVPWKCQACGSGVLQFRAKGARQRAGKLIMKAPLYHESDQANCAACGSLVAQNVEGKGWLTVR